MKDFQTRYGALNDAQKRAVDTIDGPVMVVAGPGTGKTELLSMRAANILRSTDVIPQNILCLTFTESGAHAMRERLAGLIGPDAYKVAVHTFHSFGSEIINRHGEYFYHGAHFRPADELSSYEILRAIFEKLPHDSQLASTMNGEYTYLRDTQVAISDIKKSGLTSDELLTILDRNDRFITWLQPRLNAIFAERLSKKSFSGIGSLLNDCVEYKEEPYELITYEPLFEQFHGTLAQALADAEASDSTKPLTAWKRGWCEKRDDGELTIKDEKRSKRLRAVAGIYYDYLVEMQRRALYDFDDMILRSVHALEVFDALRLNLQEQYQYILVDEFQDTNDAQMRLLWNLTNNAMSEGRPNVMVVGDDDQAIYRFQGAKLSNILDFRSLYRDVSVVTLTDNYRSAAVILDTARDTITQASERLEHSLPDVNKKMTPHYRPRQSAVSFKVYEDETAEYAALAEQVKTLQGTSTDTSIAIIARHHRQLTVMLPYLEHAGVSLRYDRQDNVLDSPPILLLELLARVVTHIADQRLDEANALLPELLAHPMWGLSHADLWSLSLDSYKARQLWIETMLEKEGKLSDIAEWLVYCAHLSLHEPLEFVIDHLTGTDTSQVPDTIDTESDESGTLADHESFTSPLRDYFFSSERLETDPSTYLAYLDALVGIRRKIRDYRPEGRLLLSEFVHFLEQYRELGLTVKASSRVVANGQPVELLTAHRSKGLEFDTVFVVGLADSVWGETARTRGKLISYPHNLQIGIGGDSSDEHIRLLFVALTRSKNDLHLSAHNLSPSGKPLLPVGYLSHVETVSATATAPSVETEQTAWRANLVGARGYELEELLRDTLATYRLSATHLCNYLDVSRGGPELFLLQNLLRFPQSMSPSAAFGSAIHTTLQRAHAHLTATGKKRPVEDLLGDFETALGEYQLASDQYDHFAKKGSDVLTHFLSARYDSFVPGQLVEQRFAADLVTDDTIRLSGAIDLMEVDHETKTIVVTDYKTGKPASAWQGKTDYEKIKLYHYRQQLLFYKLLIENTREYAGYSVTKGIVEFVEADSRGTIHRIELGYDADELAEFRALISSVWIQIQELKFSIDGEFDTSLGGIKAFEQSLLG